MEIFPLHLLVSFKKSVKSQINNKDDELVFLRKKITNAIGIAISNIDNASIKLKAIKIENILETFDGIKNHLIHNYSIEILNQIF